MLIQDVTGNWWNPAHIIRYYVDTQFNYVALETKDSSAVLYSARSKEDAQEWLDDFCVIVNIQGHKA